MSIPKARERLLNLAKAMCEANRINPYANGWSKALREIVEEEMFRSVPVRRAPRRLGALNEAQKQRVRDVAEQFPDWSMLNIANFCGTNPGRVSEVLNGKV